MARLAFLLRERAPMEWIWSIEAGPKTGMIHVHACVRGAWIDQPVLSDLARVAGFGFRAFIQDGRRLAGAYTSKMAAYTTKGANEQYNNWLQLNGGTRPWHWSRRYTAGVPMREWVREHAPPKDAGPWRMVMAHAVPKDARRRQSDEIWADLIAHVASAKQAPTQPELPGAGVPARRKTPRSRRRAASRPAPTRRTSPPPV